MIRTEVRTFYSRYLDQSLMYPGRYVLTWIKAPFMPWTLLSIESLQEGA